ncbi:MAG: hypothetical protein ACK5HT_15220 [Draconibacterium sp.]
MKYSIDSEFGASVGGHNVAAPKNKIHAKCAKIIQKNAKEKGLSKKSNYFKRNLQFMIDLHFTPPNLP